MDSVGRGYDEMYMFVCMSYIHEVQFGLSTGVCM